MSTLIRSVPNDDTKNSFLLKDLEISLIVEPFKAIILCTSCIRGMDMS